MRQLSQILSCLATAVVCSALTQAADAALLVSRDLGGIPSGLFTETFGTPSPGTDNLVAIRDHHFLSAGCPAGVRKQSGPYAAPFLSGGNGLGFGAGGASGEWRRCDDLHHHWVGRRTSGRLRHATAARYGTLFRILWGSVDNYNTLSFYNGADLVGAVTGGAVTASPDGDQGVNGTLYVNINATAGSAFRSRCRDKQSIRLRVRRRFVHLSHTGLHQCSGSGPGTCQSCPAGDGIAWAHSGQATLCGLIECDGSRAPSSFWGHPSGPEFS